MQEHRMHKKTTRIEKTFHHVATNENGRKLLTKTNLENKTKCIGILPDERWFEFELKAT